MPIINNNNNNNRNTKDLKSWDAIKQQIQILLKTVCAFSRLFLLMIISFNIFLMIKIIIIYDSTNIYQSIKKIFIEYSLLFKNSLEYIFKSNTWNINYTQK